MELQTFEKKYGRSLFGRAFEKGELLKFARRVIGYTQKSEGSKLELLFSLPGIYAMSLCYRGATVRLIKEGDVFRVMERSEKSEVLLSIRIETPTALRSLGEGKRSINECIAERSVTYKGSTEYFCVFTRVCNEGDKVSLSDARYKELYRADKQERV